jgi:hypothetical protein
MQAPAFVRFCRGVSSRRRAGRYGSDQLTQDCRTRVLRLSCPGTLVE